MLSKLKDLESIIVSLVNSHNALIDRVSSIEESISEQRSEAGESGSERLQQAKANPKSPQKKSRSGSQRRRQS